MTTHLFLKASLWHWIVLAASLLMTAEYARLVLTTETATYRVFVLVAWVVISLFCLIRLLHARRQNLMPPRP